MADVLQNLDKIIADVLPFMIEARRQLHAMPELAFEETRTAEYVTSTLSDLGYAPCCGEVGTSVTALLDSGRPGPYIMLRADMDGLPVTEETGLGFASRHSGRMHACGHDGHMAMLLGTAKVLLGLKEQLRGKILFLFQPAEEDSGGAAPIVASGLLTGVDCCLGAHLWPELPHGVLGVKSGPLMASVGRFEITVQGRGGHSSQPQLCVDALDVAGQIITALRRIPAQQVDPLTPALLTVGSLQSGTTYNVIPDTARILGCVRTYDMQLYQDWGRLIGDAAEKVAGAYGASCIVDFIPGHPAVINPPELAGVVHGAAVAAVGKDRVVEPPPSLAGEDFSCYQEIMPGCFFFIGAGSAGCGLLHNPRFDFKEDVLALGPAVFCRAVLALGQNAPAAKIE